MTTVIICEKPDAMKRIANALAEENLKKKRSEHGIEYYEFEKGGVKHIALPAVGHLFNLKQATPGWTYPIFDVKWIPSYRRKASEFSKKYYMTIKDIAKEGDRFISACDYDNEGSLIAFNILRFLCKTEEAQRMKFSTLTKQDLVKSYEEKTEHLDYQNIECGEARHYVDFFYGVNASRALLASIKKSSPRFSMLSAGRVQGPVLTLLSEKEKEIMAFVPEPFWQVVLSFRVKDEDIPALFEKDRIWNEDEAKTVFESSKGKPAFITAIDKREYRQKVPVPFNITSLQTEAYRIFGYSPQMTSGIAQDLYTAAYISYPRTSSEKLPPQIGYKEIIEALSRVPGYDKLCAKLLSLKELKPNEGKRTDTAHEAIRPTTETPKDFSKLTAHQKNIYNLVCRRFFAVFSEPAIKESVKISIESGGNKFIASGRRTLKKNWLEFYGPLVKNDETIFPDFKEGDELDVRKLEMLSKETSPPPRFSQASIIKEMEKRGLGTRATRAHILQTLYDRDYIEDKTIKVTVLGLKIAEVLGKYVPDFVDEQLTKKLEKDMEKIMKKKMTKEDVINEAEELVKKISDEFRSHEEDIGVELGDAIIETQRLKSLLGPCPNCGKDLKIMFSPATRKRFCGCSGYPECKTGFPIPLSGSITRMDKICEECNTPIIQVWRKGKRPFKMCLDPNCKTKENWGKDKKEGEKKKEDADAKKKDDAVKKKADKKKEVKVMKMTAKKSAGKKKNKTVETSDNEKK